MKVADKAYWMRIFSMIQKIKYEFESWKNRPRFILAHPRYPPAD